MDIKHFVSFDADGIQNQVYTTNLAPTEGTWYEVADIEDKFYKLVNNNPIAMTTDERSEYLSILNKSAILFNGRIKRDQALKESDWTQLPNSKLTDIEKAKWETYRQALRDYPQVLENDLTAELPVVPQ
jgi:Phage tail assembly chaperone protein